MRFSTAALIFAAAGYAAAQCPQQAILDACISSTKAALSKCADTDKDCVCTAWTSVVACYNNCPNDVDLPAAQTQQSANCGKADNPSSAKAAASTPSIGAISSSVSSSLAAKGSTLTSLASSSTTGKATASSSTASSTSASASASGSASAGSATTKASGSATGSATSSAKTSASTGAAGRVEGSLLALVGAGLALAL